ncbi:sulfate adenylyltransferase [Deltaproteobacteria bacterium Smac51]|nr:sulfate adenylyltransferase [Deltaproteobacteria bacterium Smac51]
MDRSAFKVFLKERPELIKAALVFNRLSGPPDFSADAALGAALSQRPRLWKLFPRDSSPGFWDFQSERRRLALVGPDETCALALRWGVAALAPRLARTVRAEEVLTLRREFGRELYEYALSRGLYHLGSLRDRLKVDPRLPLNREAAEGEGWRALSLCAHDWPDELRSHWLRRQGRDEVDSGCTPDEALVRQVWFRLKKILLTEVAPQWRPCFD